MTRTTSILLVGILLACGLVVAQDKDFSKVQYSGDFMNEDVFLETLYNSLTGQKSGKFIKHN